MIPALIAAKPIIKYSLLIGIPMLLLAASYTAGCVQGERNIQQAWDASIAQQAAQSVQEVVKAQTMESQVVQAIDVREREIRQKANTIRKKVLHGPTKTIVLSPATVRLHDELRGLSEPPDHGVSAADPGAGTPQVPPSGLGAPSAEVLQADAGGEIELTYEELRQAAIDFHEKYAMMRSAYRGLSEWNDGREALEKARIGE